jgi:putative membrane protein
MAMKVRRRAELAFYEHGLHKTRDATGILILLSVLERRAQILADRAIDARVPPRTWETLIETMIEDIKHDRPTQAFCRVIAECGDLLAVHFPPQGPDNPNELKDDLIQER